MLESSESYFLKAERAQMSNSHSIFFATVLLLFASPIVAQESGESTQEELKSILSVQAKCWNNEDIEGFMQTYWKSEDLTFSSGGKTTRGWQATLDNYKKRYPVGNMGQLTFDHLEITLLSDDAALVLGQWHLAYEDNNRDGNFSLVLRKLDGNWKIVHDHSSLLEVPEDNN